MCREVAISLMLCADVFRKSATERDFKKRKLRRTVVWNGCARNDLLHVQVEPIDVAVSHGPSVPSRGKGEFILGRASHLDAFSGYHSRSSLPGVATGTTAGTRADRPTRSSRTRVRSPQLSTAHDGYRPNCLTTF